MKKILKSKDKKKAVKKVGKAVKKKSGYKLKEMKKKVKGKK